MKKKALKKSDPKHSKVVPPTILTAASSPPAAVTNSQPWPVITEGPHGEPIAMPPPEELLMEAEQELNSWDLSQYSEVIGTLRRKRFSYREIAEWLSERGIPVDHNAVYRVYTNSLSVYEAATEEQEVDREAQEEAYRNR